MCRLPKVTECVTSTLHINSPDTLSLGINPWQRAKLKGRSTNDYNKIMLLFITLSATIYGIVRLFGVGDHMVPPPIANISELVRENGKLIDEITRLRNENVALNGQIIGIKNDVGIRTRLLQMATGSKTMPTTVGTQTDKTHVLDQQAFDKYVTALIDARAWQLNDTLRGPMPSPNFVMI